MKIFVKEMKLLGLTHKAAADLIGVSEKTIGNWISGKNLPSVVNVNAMKKAGFSDGAILCPTTKVEV